MNSMLLNKHDPKVIANFIIELANNNREELTNLKIQKLVYIIHGCSLGLFGQPLISHGVKAWSWGPVIPELYDSLRGNGKRPITQPIQNITDMDNISEKQTINLIENVYDVYKKYTPYQLVSMTHQKDTPWYITWHKNPYEVIENKLIQEYYKNLLLHK